MGYYEGSEKRKYFMSFVNLVSGGLDSTLVGVLAKENSVDAVPLFINYGQIAAEREWRACEFIHKKMGLPQPAYMDIAGFGKIISSGLTSKKLHVKEDAFTPNRNLLFLLAGASYGYQNGVHSVAIGLLNEKLSLFPDQTQSFIIDAERAISSSLGISIEVLQPLADFTKKDVVALANEKGISDTYSCHLGDSEPCEKCIACLEFGSTEGD